MSEIIIQLDNSTNTKAFEENKQVHKEQFEKVTQWIEEAIKKQSDKNVRLQETISVLGSRGSGKTSFLMSLKKKYQEKSENKDDSQNKVAVIEIIDPTLIEQKGHIFLTIISQIKEQVDEKLKACDCNPDNKTFAKREIWEKKLESLAHGLPSVNGIGKLDDNNWQDPEYIMHKGLRAVHSAKNLEKNFHKFVCFSLDILEKDIFLLMLDDIDVDFKQGWPVLESLRKYLTTPKIVTLLSGDMDLFSKAIRKQQWKNFGKELLINEADRQGKMGEYNELVTEMESQYLQKVLKPQNRIRLNTLWEKWLMGIKDIKVTYQSPEEAIEVTEYYKNILKSYSIINPTEARVYYSFLMNQPLRTQIQFLLSAYLFESEAKEKRANQSLILESFLSHLYENQVNIELANNVPEQLNIVILHLLLNKKILSQAYQLQPTFSDMSLNASLVGLSLLFSEKVKENPFLIFDYIIKIGYTSNLIDSLGYRKKDDNNIDTITAPSIEGLFEHAEMLQENVLRNVMGNIIAYLNAYLEVSNNEQDFWGGIIRLRGFAFKAKQSKEATDTRIDAVFNEDIGCFKRALAFFPISISKPKNNTSIVNYSVFTLLATIGEFLKLDSLLEINNHVQKLSQTRSYPMPNFKKNQTKFDENIVIESKDLDSNDELAKLIFAWKTEYPKDKLSISPYLLGKIVTRFYYALGTIEEKERSQNLGDAMHHRLIAFMNAILLEDAREHLEGISNLNHDNPNFSNSIFINNINKIKDQREDSKNSELTTGEKEKKIKENLEKLHLSRWMLSSPLLLLYLNSEVLKDENFKWFITYDKNEGEIADIETLFEKSIYNDLCEVGTQSNLPSFSGSVDNWKKTIQLLLDHDADSYNVIARRNTVEIKEKYLGTVFSRIYPSSIDSFEANADKNDELFQRWMTAGREKQNTDE